jgi:hypothetical protein
MPITDTTAQFAAGDQLLRIELAWLNDGEPAELRWRGRRAAALLTLAMTKLAGLARAENADPADAVRLAWALWATPTAEGALLPGWGLTRKHVKLGLRREAGAQQRLIDDASTRRAHVKHFTGWADDGDDTLAKLVAVQTDTAELDEPDVKDCDVYSMAAFRTARGILVRAGVSVLAAEAVIDSMLEQAATAADLSDQLGSPAAAANILRRRSSSGFHVTPTSEPLPGDLPQELWRAVVALLFGRPAGGGADRAPAIGLIQAERDGVEPASVKHLVNTTARLERLIAA